MDFSENSEHIAIAEAVRTLCAGFPDEYWRRCEAAHEFPWDFYRAMAASGWVGIALPEKYGGGGQGIQEASIVLREVAARYLVRKNSASRGMSPRRSQSGGRWMLTTLIR